MVFPAAQNSGSFGFYCIYKRKIDWKVKKKKKKDQVTKCTEIQVAGL